MMSQFAQKLSKKDIKNLAHFLSHHKADDTQDVQESLLGVDY